ncbi:HD domain-containing phosphohydrolase [Desulfomicrobium baculatum]|uniref:Response regulator receiver protein n=1 Tax=Desulfomicrobium baculatum (strain DSM 4028 / VKM B-1378 / X) TaxID=525897 RepID=C7LTI9_DESBD|nr:HD domain-containing phosphohydrolase [Desulfomicrobium baculatum]ACU89546.1 response regulator receiver protein [Desulfomicrobium baculatum DSM 4028]
MSSILIVDSDGKSLTAMQRKLRKSFETHIALGPRLGLQRIREEGPYALVLAEFSMPEMDGIDFLAEVRTLCPETTRVLVSRSPMDVASLMRAINSGKIHHVLPASCEEATLGAAVQEGVDHYKRISTSAGNMHEVHAIFAKAVHELVCWLRGDVRGVISPLLPLLRSLGQKAQNPMPTITETAILLSIIGLIVLPPTVLEKIVRGQTLTDDELLIFARHPEHAVEWVRHLPQLQEVANVLREYANALHLCLLPESAEPAERPAISMEATLLAMVLEYRLAGYAQLENAEILARMRRNSLYSQTLVKAFEAVLLDLDQDEVELSLDGLQPGMVLARAVIGIRDGVEVVMVPEGYELSRTTIVFLRQSARNGQVREPFFVRKMSVIPQEDNDIA